jgi:hypothetical protein
LINSLRRFYRRLRYNAITLLNYFKGYEKIRLPDEIENPESTDFEWIWAKRLRNKLYRIENVPFSGQLNLHDVVRCKDFPDDFPLVTEIISRSGNRAIRVEFKEETTAENAVDVIMELKAKKVFYEKAGRRIYMFNVEPNVNFESIQDFLKSKEAEGLLWLYE